jgi:hypothetical protein
VAAFNGDGVPDVAVINFTGVILLRLGRPGTPGAFEPPLILNPDPESPGSDNPGLEFAASDLAVIATTRGFLLAALDARRSLLSLYARGPDGRFTPIPGPSVPGALPVRIASADLNGDGRGDIAVGTAAGAVFVYLQDASGGFGPPDYRIEVGCGPLGSRDRGCRRRPWPGPRGDERVSGDVSLLLNDDLHPFVTVARFRAGTGLYGVESRNGDMRVRSLERTTGIATGDFNGDGVNDLIVTNTGANSVSVPAGHQDRGFLNPQPGLTFLAGQPALGHRCRSVRSVTRTRTWRS